MKVIFPILIMAILCILPGCRKEADTNMVFEKINYNLSAGELRKAVYLADSLKKASDYDTPLFYKADSLSQIAERIAIDFSVDEETVIAQIENRMGPFTNVQKAVWENRGWLEFKILNGEKMYFKRAASNLNLLRTFYEQKEKISSENEADPAMILRLKHTEEIYKASDNQSHPVVPVKMAVTYTLTVDPDVVPEGEIIRCWLPFPRGDHERQENIELMSTSNREYIIAPDSATHNTIYMEEVAKKGVATEFQISFSYQSSGQYFNMSESNAEPYNTKSDNYIKYTAELLPHICFTENVKNLADSIVGNEKNPAAVVSKLYLWFKENIPWTGALEYSTIPNISEYVYQNRRGDCGMQTLLFMSMARYKGIPVRWQSGWMVPPIGKNLHDWCEVYYEGTGWVPVDVSYDLQESKDKLIREFYISGIDSYRMIINKGLSGPLHPEKQYLRSEPLDFQRGEAEWKGGNLYFDKWDYEMKIEYSN
jgi:hypothetical protein